VFNYAVAAVEARHSTSFRTPFSTREMLDAPGGRVAAAAEAARPTVSARAVIAAGAAIVPLSPRPIDKAICQETG
jgi:hypothetical protein